MPKIRATPTTPKTKLCDFAPLSLPNFALSLRQFKQTALNTPSFSLKSAFIDFKEITKAGLAISVLFSSIAGYLLGFDSTHPFSWTVLAMLTIGGYCMVGASNAFNQVIEKDLDVLTEPLNDQSWMSTSTPYWEGPITVKGSRPGRGYLEMTGY